MADTIPDLWPPSALKTDVLTPIAILRTQATRLSQKTQGLLVAETTITTGEQDQVILSLDVIVPALNNYRNRLLRVQYTRDAIYPARVFASGLKTLETVRRAEPSWLAQSGYNETITKPIASKIAHSDQEFVGIVQEALQAPETVAMLQSLIARSNEVTSDTLPTDEEESAEQSAE